MGFNLDFLKFFDACNSVVPFKGSFLSIGSQAIHDSNENLQSWCEKEKYPLIKTNDSPSKLLRKRYNITEYVDIDMNESAEIHADLTKELSKDLYNKWDVVFNGGTLEHIYDLPSAMNNVHRLSKVNGIVIHYVPLTWLRHGYYNITPKLLVDIISSNSYRFIASAYCFKKSFRYMDTNSKYTFFQKLFYSLTCHKFSQHRSGTIITKIEDKKTDLYGLIDNMLKKSDYFPLDTLFCIAYQKKEDKDFYIPYDVYD